MTTKNVTQTDTDKIVEKSILSYPYMTARSENSTPFETIKSRKNKIPEELKWYYDALVKQYSCHLLDDSAKEKLVYRKNCPADYLLNESEYDNYRNLYIMCNIEKSNIGEEERAEFNRLTNKVYKNAMDWFKNDPEGIELANKVCLLC